MSLGTEIYDQNHAFQPVLHYLGSGLGALRRPPIAPPRTLTLSFPGSSAITFPDACFNRPHSDTFDLGGCSYAPVVASCIPEYVAYFSSKTDISDSGSQTDVCHVLVRPTWAIRPTWACVVPHCDTVICDQNNATPLAQYAMGLGPGTVCHPPIPYHMYTDDKCSLSSLALHFLVGCDSHMSRYNKSRCVAFDGVDVFDASMTIPAPRVLQMAPRQLFVLAKCNGIVDTHETHGIFALCGFDSGAFVNDPHDPSGMGTPTFNNYTAGITGIMYALILAINVSGSIIMVVRVLHNLACGHSYVSCRRVKWHCGQPWIGLANRACAHINDDQDDHTIAWDAIVVFRGLSGDASYPIIVDGKPLLVYSSRFFRHCTDSDRIDPLITRHVGQSVARITMIRRHSSVRLIDDSLAPTQAHVCARWQHISVTCLVELPPTLIVKPTRQFPTTATFPTKSRSLVVIVMLAPIDVTVLLGGMIYRLNC